MAAVVAQTKQPYISPQEYLEWERAQEISHEYHDGVLVAMSGGTLEHGVITSNVSTALCNQLRGQPCVTFAGNVRVEVAACNRYFYPDVAVLYGTPVFLDGHRDTVRNPSVTVEVLSESTQNVDRVVKLDCYRRIESLTAYVLIAQDQPRMECYQRTADGAWRYESYIGSEAVLPLPSLGCELRAADIYANITFPPETVPDNS